jgi:hypothetical protein
MVKRSFNPLIQENYKEGDYVNLLLEKLQHMKRWYDENKNDIRFHSSINELLDYYWEKYEKSYDLLTEEEKQILDSIVRRSVNNLNKLIFLTAVWKMKKDITMEDITDCFELILKCIDSVRDLIVGQTPETRHIDSILMMLKDGSDSVSNVYKQMEVLGYKSTPTKKKFLDKIINMGYISRWQDGRRHIVSLTKLGFEKIGLGE